MVKEFLDTEGAFNQTSIEVVVEEAELRGQLIKCLQGMLICRHVISNL